MLAVVHSSMKLLNGGNVQPSQIAAKFSTRETMRNQRRISEEKDATDAGNFMQKVTDVQRGTQIATLAKRQDISLPFAVRSLSRGQ